MKAGLAALASLYLIGACARAPAPEVGLGPKGYVISENEVTNPEAYEAYKAQVAPPEGRILVIQFPGFAAAKAFNISPDSAGITRLRTDNSVSRVIIAEGLMR